MKQFNFSITAENERAEEIRKAVADTVMKLSTSGRMRAATVSESEVDSIEPEEEGLPVPFKVLGVLYKISQLEISDETSSVALRLTSEEVEAVSSYIKTIE